MSRRPLSSRELVERIASRPRPIPRGPPPRPFAAGSATCSHLLRELQVGHGSRAARVMAGDGKAVAGGFPDAHIPGDNRLEYELREVLADLALDVLSEPRAPVVH